MTEEGVTRRDDIWESAAEAAAEPKEPDTVLGALGSGLEEMIREFGLLFVTLSAIGLGWSGADRGGWAYGLIPLAVAGVVLAWVGFARRWPRSTQWAVIVVVFAVNAGLIAVLRG